MADVYGVYRYPAPHARHIFIFSFWRSPVSLQRGPAK
ncbi:hypothetical protein FAES_2301 [Fibrella aestuarina BUZ 2]|uniref:Uncharacterized protein n=1 Tax=Fibrella aestuarina BUZ 2 TaxID=1166018 RepID=I0K857_9BACT|nr:hypothetical protein FAES_2301 [Fibrella aestuarina BUZ 2]